MTQLEELPENYQKLIRDYPQPIGETVVAITEQRSVLKKSGPELLAWQLNNISQRASRLTYGKKSAKTLEALAREVISQDSIGRKVIQARSEIDGWYTCNRLSQTLFALPIVDAESFDKLAEGESEAHISDILMPLGLRVPIELAKNFSPQGDLDNTTYIKRFRCIMAWNLDQGFVVPASAEDCVGALMIPIAPKSVATISFSGAENLKPDSLSITCYS